jgi:hypothetical protein
VSALALISTAPVSATTLEEMTLADMAQSAEIVVVGTPIDAEFVTQDGQTFTHTTFAVSADAFGGAPSTVTVKTPGGRSTLGRLQVSEVVAGAPAFAGGQEAMLFLNKAEGGAYEVAGFNQGYFGVTNGAVHLAPSDGGATAIANAMEQVRKARALGAGKKIDD